MVIVDVSICHDRDFIYTSIPKLILEIEYWPSKNIEKTKQKKRQSFSQKKNSHEIPRFQHHRHFAGQLKQKLFSAIFLRNLDIMVLDHNKKKLLN